MKLIFFIISVSLYAQYSNKTEIEQCITSASGKLYYEPQWNILVHDICQSSSCYLLPSGFNCIYYKYNGTIVEIDTVKKAAYDDSIASVEQVQAQYEESQLYNNIQDFCLYAYQTACASLPSSTKTLVSNSLSLLPDIYGKSTAYIKKLMNKKRNAIRR